MNYTINGQEKRGEGEERKGKNQLIAAPRFFCAFFQTTITYVAH